MHLLHCIAPVHLLYPAAATVKKKKKVIADSEWKWIGI